MSEQPNGTAPTWFVERQHPSEPGRMQVSGPFSRARAELVCDDWRAEAPSLSPHVWQDPRATEPNGTAESPRHKLLEVARFLRACRGTEPAELFEEHAQTCEAAASSDRLTSLHGEFQAAPTPRPLVEARGQLAKAIGLLRLTDTKDAELSRQRAIAVDEAVANLERAAVAASSGVSAQETSNDSRVNDAIQQLRSYVQHEGDCHIEPPILNCTCGLDDVLKAIGGK